MNGPHQTTNVIQITTGTIIKAILIIIAFYLVFVLQDVILAILASIVIAAAIEPFTNWFIKRKIPRIISVIVIYFFVITVLAGIIYLFLPILLNDIQQLIGELPNYLDTISNKAGSLGGIPAFQDFINNIDKIVDEKLFLQNADNDVTGTTVGFISITSSVFGGFLSLVLIFVLSFYLSVQENGISNFLRIITPIQHEKYVLDLWSRSKKKIGYWMQGQLLLGVLVGVLTFLGLSVLGIKNALFLAIIAGVLELIPIFGPIIASVPAIVVAIPQGGLTLVLLVASLYIIIQQFENHLFHPLVVKKIVGIPAIVAILALVIGAQLAGFLGIMLSVPVAAALMEYINDLERKKLSEIRTLN